MFKYPQLFLYYIKKILYQKDWLTPKTTHNKIDYIIAHDVSLYDNIYRSKIVTFINDDMSSYTEVLNYINTFDIYGEYIVVKKISPNLLKTITLNRWCSNDGRLIANERDALLVWLEEAKLFLNLYDVASKSVSLNIIYSNSMKVRPYAINIKDIVDEIYSILKNNKHILFK